MFKDFAFHLIVLINNLNILLSSIMTTTKFFVEPAASVHLSHGLTYSESYEDQQASVKPQKSGKMSPEFRLKLIQGLLFELELEPCGDNLQKGCVSIRNELCRNPALRDSLDEIIGYVIDRIRI